MSLSPIKIMVIIAVVLLLLGPDKLPEVAHKLGSSWRALKRVQEKVESEIREVIPDLPSAGDLARIARSPVDLLNQLADHATTRDEAATAAAAQASDEDEQDEDEASKLPRATAPPTRIVPRTDYSPQVDDPSLN